MQARCKALAFRRIAKQCARFGRFPGVTKVNDPLAFRHKDLAMLVGILREHATTDCRDFEAPHDMAVAIGAAQRFTLAAAVKAPMISGGLVFNASARKAA
jgi:hypothetical protein